MPLIVGSIGQKGGVGKSTLARLLAVTYAKSGWRVKIADFDTGQMTSTKWLGRRLKGNIAPAVESQPFSNVAQAIRGDHDLIILDSKAESNQQTFEIAKASNMLMLPTSTTLDDLEPQLQLAFELRSRGVDLKRLIIVLNNTLDDSPRQIDEARRFLERYSLKIAKAELPMKPAYRLAQNTGRSVLETQFKSLNERADALAQELVDHLAALSALAA